MTATRTSDNKIIRQPFPGNIIPSNRIHPGMKYVADALLPMPNRSGFTNNLLQTEGQSNDRDMIVARFDHSFGQNHTVFGRILHQNVGQLSPNVSGLYVSENRYDVRNYGGGWNHIFNPSTVLEFRYGFNNPDNPGCPAYRDGLTRKDFLLRPM